jgi:hypothetical protein
LSALPLSRRGLHVVGEVAVGMTIFTLLPFAALCLLGEPNCHAACVHAVEPSSWEKVGASPVGLTFLREDLLSLSGLPHVKPSNWLVVDWGTVEWLPFLNVMFWCAVCYAAAIDKLMVAANLHRQPSSMTISLQEPQLLGFCVVFGRRSAEPQQDLPPCSGRSTQRLIWHLPACYPSLQTDFGFACPPHSVTGAVVLVIVTYLLPLLVGLGVTSKTDDWELGYFAAVGLKVWFPGCQTASYIILQLAVGDMKTTAASWVDGIDQQWREPALVVCPCCSGWRQVAGLVDCGSCGSQPSRPV